MPAPSASLMKGFWKTGYTYPTTAQTEEYVQKLFGELERAWNEWEKGFKFGGIAVIGAGIGGWAGTGSGGSVTAQPFAGKVFTFYEQTKPQEKFQTTLYSTMKDVLSELVQSITFGTVSYMGTSSASPLSPGVFSANVTPIPLKVAAPASAVAGIGARWIAQLTPPDFDLTHPQCAASAMANALASAVEKAFTLWTVSTTISGSTVQGPASPGAGAGGGASQFNGVLL